MVRQSVPILPSAEHLAGTWSLAGESGVVQLDLAVSPAAVGGAPAWSLEAPPGDLAALGLEEVMAWRPAPDGIALVNAGGAIVAFFSTEAPDRYVARRNGSALILEPRRP